MIILNQERRFLTPWEPLEARVIIPLKNLSVNVFEKLRRDSWKIKASCSVSCSPNEDKMLAYSNYSISFDGVSGCNLGYTHYARVKQGKV